MREFVFFLLASCLGMTATARSLSPSEALSRVADQPASRVSRAAAVPVPVMTFETSEVPTFYVFNQPDDGGWMIVSADDVAAPVIGYSDKGSFDPQNLPENFKGWLEQCGRQISQASMAGVEPYAVSRGSDKDPIAPLMSTIWDQTTPFNLLCPSINGFRTPTGCVATAMAQVMKYHNWPETAGENAKFSYTWIGGPASTPELSADFSNFKFDWENMLDSYRMGSSDIQAEAVSKLMQACGYSVEMMYNSVASAAYNEYVGYALSEYFKYDQGLHNELRNMYSSAEWEDLIYDNLKNYGPVVYWGTGDVGHCFVCDGYKDNGYFHFNWGWSGSSDGYFLLDALNPLTIGTGGGTGGYNNSQGALLGIKPAGEQQSERRYTFSTSGIAKISTPGTYLTMHGQFKSNSTFAVNGQGRFIIYSEDGSKRIASVAITTPSGFTDFGVTSGSQWLLSGAIPTSEVGEGVYRVYPGILVDGKEYIFRAPKSEPGYVIYTRTKNGSQYVNSASLPDVGKKVVENLSTNGNFYLGSRIKISGVAKFIGDAETIIYVKASLIDSEGSVLTTADGSTVKFTPEGNAFEFISLWFDERNYKIEPGEYTFALCYYAENDYVYKPLSSCPVTIEKYEYPSYEVTGLEVDNASAVDPNAIRLTVSADGKVGASDETLYFGIRKAGSETNILQQTVSLYVTAGNSVKASQTLALPDALPGEEYEANVFVYRYSYPAGMAPVYLTSPVSFTIADSSGISDIEADGNEPVEYFNLQGIRVDAYALTPGIYIRRQGAKTTKILVR